MPELRRNPVTGEWVIIAPERASRPDIYRKERVQEKPDITGCPFCPGREKMTPPEVLAYGEAVRQADERGWLLRVVPNKYPALEPLPETTGTSGMLASRPAVGFHEVIVHSPDHWKGLGEMHSEEVHQVLRAYRERILYLRQWKEVKHIQVIVNYGREAGASIEHAHSQLFALPLIPPALERELNHSRSFHRRKGQCIFCALLEREMDGKRLLCSNQDYTAILAFAPRFPFETWILPRRHSPRFEEIPIGELSSLAEIVSRSLKSFFSALNDPPYNLYLHTSPCQVRADEYFHWHMEILPRLSTWGGLELGSGTIICTMPPEEAALLLKRRL